MAQKKKKLSPKYQVWVDARRKFRLSHRQIQMARELGMNPKKFGGLANHDQEPWKLPLPEFIEDLYSKRFGREEPEVVCSIEELVAARKKKKEEKRKQKAAASLPPLDDSPLEESPF
ncbi:MAG: hypothetical protein R6U56_05640 [Opitutales bacterium]